MTITTKEAIKELVGGTFDASADALLTKLAAAADAFVVSVLGYDPRAKDYVEFKHGLGGIQTLLNVPNVNSITTLKVDGTTIPPSTAVNNPGYVFNPSGHVYLRGYRFVCGVMNVEAHYNAGFTTLPGDIVMAATEIATLRYKTRSNIGIQSKTLANETIVFADKDMPESARQALRDYRRMYLL